MLGEQLARKLQANAPCVLPHALTGRTTKTPFGQSVRLTLLGCHPKATHASVLQTLIRIKAVYKHATAGPVVGQSPQMPACGCMCSCMDSETTLTSSEHVAGELASDAVIAAYGGQLQVVLDFQPLEQHVVSGSMTAPICFSSGGEEESPWGGGCRTNCSASEWQL